MFGLFKKKPPTKAGLAYRRIEVAIEAAFRTFVLGSAGGANNAWEIKDSRSGQFLFMLDVWGLKGGSSAPCHADDLERLHIKASGLWSGHKRAERHEDAVKQAVAPFGFRPTEWESNRQDWEIVAEFETDLEPDTRDLLDKLYAFTDACRRGFKILES